MINVAVISAQSTVVVPDLSNLTSAQAIATLTAAELVVGSTSTTTSGANSSNSGLVATQTVSAGTVVERYSSVGYVTYYYVSAPPPPTTYYCTTKWPGGSYTYTSNTDESGYTCDASVTSCSTSTYPNPNDLSIPACPGGGGGGGSTGPCNGGPATTIPGCYNPFPGVCASCLCCVDECGNETCN